MSKPAVEHLRGIIDAQKIGQASGFMSVCSANQFVLEAAMLQAKAQDTILCIESTANQVNQFGGYTGMTPAEFAAFVFRIAETMNFRKEKILLGGDHIGPGPWQTLPAETAMAHARDLVRDCVMAGYEKIHLDACMACIDDEVDDGSCLPVRVSVQRSAVLCRVAEDVAANRPGDRFSPIYVIGTDVPIPGGMYGEEHSPRISKIADVENTIASARECFDKQNLKNAWDRTIAVVVQPGVDFGPETIVTYNRKHSEKLVSYIKNDSKFVYEAHATDYQTRTALSEMVEDQFAILKVGPALTFAFREALTALAIIEEEWLSPQRGVTLSKLRQVLETAMRKNPAHWIKHHHGNNGQNRCSRYYSFSDRIRYYWTRPEIQASIHRLLQNLGIHKIPLTLISQYLPKQYDMIREETIQADPKEIIYSKIMEVTSRYSAACRTGEPTYGS